MNGHVACPSCWSKVQHKCHICSVLVVTRNIALEKGFTCPLYLLQLSCHKSVFYSHKKVHADKCDFGPSLCPIPTCGHKASSGAWWEHFLKVCGPSLLAESRIKVHVKIKKEEKWWDDETSSD